MVGGKREVERRSGDRPQSQSDVAYEPTRGSSQATTCSSRLSRPRAKTVEHILSRAPHGAVIMCMCIKKACHPRFLSVSRTAISMTLDHHGRILQDDDG
ncbi:hypothetical protein PoB_000728900 [Plakobranchus ocellatus]|uniref:Uncharacterized protein n=1 Tax=Plakobranchus ocellatus TaxID=259542 RepID=A0AAV3YFF4_9GAST|nr:hypothetical protein PoB_000728900 [Plakobranchus ocellatus]